MECLSVLREEMLSVCKVVFGAEPKDYEVWEYLLKNLQSAALQSIC